LVAEAREIAQVLNVRQAPCGRAIVSAMLMPLVSIYGLPERSEIEWTAFWMLYGEALHVLPREALAEAIVLYNREGKHFPKPGELFKLASPMAERIRVAAWRTKQALEHHPKVGRIPPEERAKVRAMMEADGLLTPGGDVKTPRYFTPPTPAQARLPLPPIQRPQRAETPLQAAERARRMVEATPGRFREDEDDAYIDDPLPPEFAAVDPLALFE
jgi:hypothetical protein